MDRSSLGDQLKSKEISVVKRLRRSVVVVVDAGSTTLQLAGALEGYGYSIVHVRSKPHRLSGVSRVPILPNYQVDIDCSDGTEAAVTYLTEHQLSVQAVIAGSDLGVALADRLALELGCRGNDPASSHLRRHKGSMLAAVAARGLRTIPTLVTSNIADAIDWCSRYDWDIALKPAESSASVGFVHVTSADTFLDAFETVIGSSSSFGEPVLELLIQPFITGVEYAINAILVDGCVNFINAWRTEKRDSNGHMLYDFESSVDLASPTFLALEAYALQVLPALELVNGPVHMELIVDADGPMLMEVGARLMGSIAISQEVAAYGTNSVLLLAEYAINPESLESRCRSLKGPDRVHNAMVQMLASTEGILRGYDLDFLRGLASFHGVDLNLAEGDKIVITKDSLTSPGLIFLSHARYEQVREDYVTIRKAEDCGTLYQLLTHHDAEQPPTHVAESAVDA
jgi:biotin carboxylase